MLFDLFLIAVAVAAIIVAVHYRAKAKVADTRSSYHATIATDLESFKGTLRAIVDNKFEALGKWLSTELAKHTESVKNAAVAPVAISGVALPDGPLAPITDDGAEQMLSQMTAAIEQLADKKNKLEEALRVKQRADKAVLEVLGE